MPCIHAALFAVTLLVAGGDVVMHEQCLLQMHGMKTRGAYQMEGEACSALKNQGSYFSVPVCVGTPPQCFDVVADTGSDAVIVPSCVCGETPGAGCSPHDKCFRGTNRSSTFSIPENAAMISMSFGSGTIEAAVAKDVVRVGDLKVTMDDGVLLMINRAALKISGAFEGILGLGIPKNKSVIASLLQGPSGDKEMSDAFKVICSMVPMLCDDLKNQPGGGVPDTSNPSHSGQEQGGGDVVKERYDTKLFLEQARVDRFSMCFRDGAQSGALRLGLSSLSSPIQNIGTLHWGLNFQGLSVGARSAPAPTETIFCGPETMKQGMETPCGIIPDSGTTLLMGPEEQVLALEAGICSKWERCQTYSKGMPSSNAFRQLLLRCGDWLTEERGLLEIPSFFFHVKNGDGTPEAYELTAWAWVTETIMRDEDDSTKRGCTSAIGPMEYFTQKNGPVWIFGHPLFYEYNVGYDMSTKQISLQKGQCEPCSADDGPVSLSASGERRWPRAAPDQPRIPYYNVNLPL